LKKITFFSSHVRIFLNCYSKQIWVQMRARVNPSDTQCSLSARPLDP